MSRIVIALGGNALGNTPEEQKNKIRQQSETVKRLISEYDETVITHGNGPQVGAIEKGMAYPLAECTAMSEGYIGYHLQEEYDAVTVITRVLVDEKDEAFSRPSKPIGAFYDRPLGDNYVEDAGRGYRKVVPSPMPVDILEKDSIRALLDNGYTVIACGGGGIPVNSEGESVEAVVDKDYASELLAELIDADVLSILTAVDRVKVNFNRENETDLDEMNVSQAEEYIAAGEFAPGSMLPKVTAAVKFVKSRHGRKAFIGYTEIKDE